MRKAAISLLLLSPSHSQDPTTAGPAPVWHPSGRRSPSFSPPAPAHRDRLRGIGLGGRGEGWGWGEVGVRMRAAPRGLPLNLALTLTRNPTQTLTPNPNLTLALTLTLTSCGPVLLASPGLHMIVRLLPLFSAIFLKETAKVRFMHGHAWLGSGLWDGSRVRVRARA